MKKIKLILDSLKSKSREENITEISNEIVKSITQTVLDGDKFTSVEMAFIANSISVGVKDFLSARKEKLSNELLNATEALEKL